MALAPSRTVSKFIRLLIKSNYQNLTHCGPARICYRQASTASSPSDRIGEENKSLVLGDSHAKQILAKEFPNHFRDGQFVSRMSYVEFIDEALQRAKELGLEKDLELYKELLRIFPAGKFGPTYKGEFGNFHLPQQLAAVRVLRTMYKNGLTPDRDFERAIVDTFSLRSDVWLLIARMNYWSMKFRNLDPHPLPEKLPKEPHQLAKLAIKRMLPDFKSIITVTNTSKVPDSIDKTWLVSAQSPAQQELIDRLDEKSTLYIEDGGLTYVGEQYLSYFILKYYVDEATLDSKKEEPPSFNFNTLKMSFFGKPIKKKLEEIKDKHYVDGSYILAIGATGTSSQDSLLSWLKILQQRNPKLTKLNVVFKMSRPSPEIIKYEPPPSENDGKAKDHSTEEASYSDETVR